MFDVKEQNTDTILCLMMQLLSCFGWLKRSRSYRKWTILLQY